MSQSVRVVHDGSWHRPGGGARVARELARALDASVTVGHCADPSFWRETGLDVEIPFQNQLHGLPGRLLPGPAQELRLGQLMRSLEMDEDIIVSSGTASKWFVPKSYQHHVHYCHVPPPRFYGEGQGEDNVLKWGMQQTGGVLDQHFAGFVDEFLANSEWTKQRVEKHYDAEAAVLNPPVRTDRFEWAPPSDEEYFVMIAGRLVDMKRPVVVAEAFRDVDAELVIIGDGPLREECEAVGGVHVYGGVSDWGVEMTVAHSIGGIAMAEGEHCGITPKEIQAAGKPAIVPNEQNLCNHVVDGITGRIVEPTPEGVRDGVRDVLEMSWDRTQLQAEAEEWSTDTFHERARELILDESPDEKLTEADYQEILTTDD